MSDEIIERAGKPVLLCAPDGPPLAGPQDAVDLIGATYGRDVEVVAVPVERLDARFFTLRTGVAGEIMQKFVNYGLRFAVVGDISAQVEASTALRDLVRESNRGRHIWFVPDLDALDARLG